MLDTDLVLEALSALSGCDVQLGSGPSQLNPQDFVNIVALRQFYKQEGLNQLEYPSLGSLSLVEQDDPDQDLYSAPAALTAPPTGPVNRTTVRINPQDFLDRKFDYDFTNIKDGDKTFLRGNERYVRPCGWNRVALKVSQKYDDGSDVWLGTGKDAWPVSYQGHSMDGSLGLILTRGEKEIQGNTEDDSFLEVAATSLLANETRGRGIYSTPEVTEAEKHCKTFKSKKDGKNYKVLLQNRINPKNRKHCQRDNVWLVYVPEDSNNVQTRALVQESVRPYGLLLKQV